MTGIPAPVMPELADLAAYLIGGVMIVLGAAMLTWGRSFGRGLVTVGCGLAGYFLAALPLNLPYFPLAARQLAFIFVLLCFGFVFERLVWGALAAVLLAAVALTVGLWTALAPTGAQTQPASLTSMAQSWWLAAWPEMLKQWQAPPIQVVLIAGGALLMVFILSLFCPRLIRIVMCCILGAAAMLVGLAIVVSHVLGWFWGELWSRATLAMEIAAALALVGIVGQLIVVARHDRLERARRAADEEDKAAAERRRSEPKRQ